ncbi:MAG: DUF4230 domain-containing protein [Actinobacteria bacterium]|nr:DUF4230 domain-containing protein [Actinomycetota bacterium]
MPTGLVALGLVVLGLILAVNWVGGLIPDLRNPFTSETVDRTGPAVLKSIRDLRAYQAASGHFEVIVDVERDTRFVPDALKGERVLFVAAGDVDAAVDFAAVEDGAVEVSDDRRAVTLELPPAHFQEPELDLDRSYVYHRDRGLIDRLQSLVGEGGDDAELYRLAEDKLAAAARDGSGLLARAEANTRAMLISLLRSLGFTRIDIRFADV